ncbi:hypothetical protein TcasGA2_TC034605 [Tribolium castaneum]|uniref:Uncharacterized protein n=1 Tax=Tribolium castaneum TaxID=7070 RepID=A0A139WL54_TRICA|nr:hypothetical protein TcasGA2_TC034605 [Tribolium castaneum]
MKASKTQWHTRQRRSFRNSTRCILLSHLGSRSRRSQIYAHLLAQFTPARFLFVATLAKIPEP